jgi:L-fucose mutarotase
MLLGIHPLLSGELLLHLDAMGHSDAVVVADAHFPSARLARHLVTLPGTSTPEVVAALRTVLPLDDASPLELMASADEVRLPVQDELVDAAGLRPGDARYIERFAFYERAAEAFLIVRTGEQRSYANALLRKGLVGAS